MTVARGGIEKLVGGAFNDGIGGTSALAILILEDDLVAWTGRGGTFTVACRFVVEVRRVAVQISEALALALGSAPSGGKFRELFLEELLSNF